MGQCISKSKTRKEMMILPSLEEKYQKKIRKTKSIIVKSNRSKQIPNKWTQSFLDFKECVNLNKNPLLTEYK